MQNIVKVNACRCYSRDPPFKQKSTPFKDAIYLQEIAALCNNLRYPNILPINLPPNIIKAGHHAVHIDMQTTLLYDQALHLNSFQVVNDRSANSSMNIKYN
jgi:hypothetical protein